MIEGGIVFTGWSREDGGGVCKTGYICIKINYAQTTLLRQPKLPSQRISKPFDRLCNLIRTGCRKSSPEEHLLLGPLAFRLEPAAARDQHAVVNRGMEDFPFDLVAGLAGCEGWVFLPIDFDPVLWWSVTALP